MALHVPTGCRQAVRTLTAQQRGLVTNNLSLAFRTRAAVLKFGQLNPHKRGPHGASILTPPKDGASGIDTTQGTDTQEGAFP